MNTAVWVIIAVVVLILLFILVKFIKSCLPKIIFGLIILAALAYWVYWSFIK